MYAYSDPNTSNDSNIENNIIGFEVGTNCIIKFKLNTSEQTLYEIY